MTVDGLSHVSVSPPLRFAADAAPLTRCAAGVVVACALLPLGVLEAVIYLLLVHKRNRAQEADGQTVAWQPSIEPGRIRLDIA